jgi:hypothetical protein
MKKLNLLRLINLIKARILHQLRNQKRKWMELDILEEQILNDDGEVDYEKIRQLDKKGIQPLQTVDHT